MKTKNGKIMLSSKCAVFNCKKPKFIKAKAKRLLSNLTGVKNDSNWFTINKYFVLKVSNECNSKQAFISRT